MNDGKKILAVILGAIFGFGAVAAITRSFSKEEEPEKEIEQETPGKTKQEELFPLLATNVITTDIDESEIVAYVEIPSTYAGCYGDGYLSALSNGGVYSSVAFKIKDSLSNKVAYTGNFNVYAYDVGTSDFGTLDTRNSFVLLTNEMDCTLLNTYYIPITSSSLAILKHMYEFNNNTNFSWTEDVYFSISIDDNMCLDLGCYFEFTDNEHNCIETCLLRCGPDVFMGEIKIIKA